ncbi:hypothetical protein BX666DRAFT_854021 [Dichotomocladium elegans]|nr:hypothetical protein BX666DRAFT_854021 [Dichotomocladium elegans]
MDGGWRNTSQKKQHYKSWKEGGDRSANGSSDWSGSGAQWGAYSNDDGSTEWKQSYKRSTGRKQNGWLGKNETAGNIASEDNQGTGSSHGWDTEKKPANVSVGQTLQQHQQQELQQPQQYEQDEVKTVSISLNSITQQQLPPTQPPGLNVTNTLTSSYTNTQPTMLQQQQPIFQLLSVDEIRSMSVELIAGVIQNLQQDYNRLYREMELMKITLACQQQQNQLDQARNQTEKEGYIQLIQTLRNSNEGLQNKLASLQQQQQQQTMSYDGAGNAINGGTTAGFGGQDLFSTLRQEITSSQPRQHHHYRRGGKRHFYDKHVNARCSNCGDLGHSSSECTDACRYCNSTDHLSEACHQSQ